MRNPDRLLPPTLQDCAARDAALRNGHDARRASLQTFLARLAAGAGETKTTEERRAAYRADIPGYPDEIREADRRLAVPRNAYWADADLRVSASMNVQSGSFWRTPFAFSGGRS